jgi:hypothetical protein
LCECDEANEKNAASLGRAVYARRKGLLEQAKKVTTGVRSHKQERKRGGLIIGAPDLCGAFERRAICGLEIPTGSGACDKDSVETYRSAEKCDKTNGESGSSRQRRGLLSSGRAALGISPSCNTAVDLTLPPRATTLLTEPTEPPLMARAIKRFGDSAVGPL